VTRATTDATGVHSTGEGALVPARDDDDWSAEERSLAARRNRYDPHADDSPVSGTYAETADGRRWEVAPSTIRCNKTAKVHIEPPYTDEWVECEPLHGAVQWRPSTSRRLYAVAGLRDDHPMVAAMRRLTTGAGDYGHRVVYVGPYAGERRDLRPLSPTD
jgi:hypothetical protein